MRIKAYKVCCCVSIFCGSCLILFAFRSTIFVGKVWNSFSILNQKYYVDKSKYVQMSPTQLREQRMQKRVQHLRSTCKLADINRYNFDFRQVSENFYGNKEANLSYCKVPKAGSSFMTEIFLVLEKDRVQSVDEIFEISRSHVHVIGNRKLSTSALIKAKQSNSVTLVVSRNPYSRLYSAYVDKFYLFGLVKEAREISKKNGKRSLSCGYNVTFTEFLDYVISKAYGGYQINRHWAPVYLLCHACDVRYDIVSKTESLSADIEYVLDNINISYETRNKLIKLIHNKIDNKSVISLLNTYITLWKQNRKLCPDFIQYLSKIWNTLQIQGKLKSKVPFPRQEFSRYIDKKINTDKIIKIMLEYVTKYKLSSNEKRLQRRQALIEAFDHVKESTIGKLQELYKLDFLLFQYDNSPPT